MRIHRSALVIVGVAIATVLVSSATPSERAEGARLRFTGEQAQIDVGTFNVEQEVAKNTWIVTGAVYVEDMGMYKIEWWGLRKTSALGPGWIEPSKTNDEVFMKFEHIDRPDPTPVGTETVGEAFGREYLDYVLGVDNYDLIECKCTVQ